MLSSKISQLNRDVRMGNPCSLVSHLLFANDCIIFQKASEKRGSSIKGNFEDLQSRV
jgi:hypothetical protein